MQRIIVSIILLLILTQYNIASAQNLVLTNNVTPQPFSDAVRNDANGNPGAVIDVYSAKIDEMVFEGDIIIDKVKEEGAKARLYVYVPSGSSPKEIVISKPGYTPFHLVFQPGELIPKKIYRVMLECQNDAPTKKDDTSAEELFSKGKFLYDSQDYTNALLHFRKAAEQGHALSQFRLGVCYAQGNGVPQDYSEAVRWYTIAAEQGNWKAQTNLGVCYEYGDGVPQNYSEAIKWYTKAAEQGDAYAQFNMGRCYGNGDGVPQNYSEAVKWYMKAAEQGLADAQFNLGLCYKHGNGVPQNYSEAVKWYTKAAEQGLASAQVNLGLCYDKGDGVPKNYSEAVKWYRKAAEQGNAKAQDNLNKLQQQLNGQ